ncbi:MAG: hypothetical protein ACRELF_10625, partial [Gemmataceae bacterium]
MQLTANVTDTTTPGTTVNEGKVLFTVVNGTGQTIGTAASKSVTSNGSASVSYTLPANMLAGSYTINVSYSDSSGDFKDGGDTSAPLAVSAASTTLTAKSVMATYSTSLQDVTLSATVTSTVGPVNAGKVAFTVVNGTGKTIGSAISATVSSN